MKWPFDVILSATIYVPAATEGEARRLLHETIDCADSNLGAWPNGDPIFCEVSLNSQLPTLASDIFKESNPQSFVDPGFDGEEDSECTL